MSMSAHLRIRVLGGDGRACVKPAPTRVRRCRHKGVLRRTHLVAITAGRRGPGDALAHILIAAARGATLVHRCSGGAAAATLARTRATLAVPAARLARR